MERRDNANKSGSFVGNFGRLLAFASSRSFYINYTHQVLHNGVKFNYCLSINPPKFNFKRIPTVFTSRCYSQECFAENFCSRSVMKLKILTQTHVKRMKWKSVLSWHDEKLWDFLDGENERRLGNTKETNISLLNSFAIRLDGERDGEQTNR
jgi:hypothetical protein